MISVGVIGASGYTGLELIKMLITHKEFEIEYLATTTGDTTLNQLHPSLDGVLEIDIEKVSVNEISKRCQLVFLALPHKTSMSIAKEILAKGVKVVDLSADYRLEQDIYEANYCEHSDIDNLDKSVYALIEYYRDEIKNTNLSAGPGCYPTATLLGLLPFMDYIDENAPIFVDAKSGVSGAGKKLSNTTHFVTINDNMFAYSPLTHRHSPEIEEKVRLISGKDVSINFVPHLIPATRGELISIYATLKDNSIEPLEILKERYKDDKFIRIRENSVDIKNVAGTHFCDIYAQKNKNAIFINSSIDNLLRGASSQALVSANLMCGLDENEGIPTISYRP
ncbi:N-acetyl-gamma-glutamyl-phosphate reductase [hydrothermal vent metagenome]|uniref:N-acetyl-gamma-glutamyl-phosphate reductase n=1 Tax=hydrothermal vent metagenome TaxID=652676 RepID=A0A1W1EJT5_9ZZZZ